MSRELKQKVCQRTRQKNTNVLFFSAQNDITITYIKEGKLYFMSETKKLDIKKIFTIENMLCFFIIICPILDVSSFIFRKYFNTSISISTFIRPIIPIIAITYIFFKDSLKPQLLITAGIYGVYALCHIYIFYRIKTGCAYGNELREIQYLINYTFMVMNLFIYLYFFTIKNREKEIKDEEKGRAIEKLKKSVLIALTIYISLMYLALITKTSSFTYAEDQVGYKGWFESGNSIGTIMILSLFITLPMISKKNSTGVRVWSFMVTVLVGAYLTTLLGTRTGLFGFVIAILAYIMLLILHGLIHNKNISKKVITFGTIAFTLIAILVVIFGSKTIERRNQLQNREDAIEDTITGQTAHVTGDIVKLVKQIKEGTLDEDYMSNDMQQTILELYNTANEKNISSTNMRALQFIYHSTLIKEQNSIPLLLFGNGYMLHFYEMIFEMEVPAFLYNFGVIGFFLYFMPFLSIAIYGIYILIKKVKNATVEFTMVIAGLCFAIIISFLSGYTFFNSSTMIIIIVLCSLVINGIKDLEDSEIKIYDIKRRNKNNNKNN